jgi:hypothetical protein
MLVAAAEVQPAGLESQIPLAPVVPVVVVLAAVQTPSRLT